MAPSTSASEARREHDAVLAAGEHLFQQLPLRVAEPGDADFAMEMDLDRRFTNPRGGLQGGLVATLADIVAGRALLEVVPTDHHLTTADLTIHYLRGVTIGPARAEARIVRCGRTLAVVTVEIIDAGAAVREAAAICTLSFAVLPPRPTNTDPALPDPDLPDPEPTEE